MSRVGKQPISIPNGVTITADDAWITVKGSKGELKQFSMPGISVTLDDSTLTVARASDTSEHRAKHGLMRSLIANMIQGVSEGFEKKLEIQGVGFRVNLQGKKLNMQLGYSHDVNFDVPADIEAEVNQNIITIKGISKQRVGQIAAEIRALRKPEPYKGKGIRYVGEQIVRKAGKSGKEG